MARYLLNVRGRSAEWAFVVNGDADAAKVWAADGLDVFEVAHSIPAWVADIGLSRPWCAAQSFWRLLWN